MFDTYLQEGDVVYLKSGTLVAVPGQRSILTDQGISPFCPFETTICVKVGKDYQSRTDASKERDRIRETIKQAFADDFIPLDESILDRFLIHQIRNPEKVSSTSIQHATWSQTLNLKASAELCIAGSFTMKTGARSSFIRGLRLAMIRCCTIGFIGCERGQSAHLIMYGPSE